MLLYSHNEREVSYDYIRTSSRSSHTQATAAVDKFFNDVLKGEDPLACGFGMGYCLSENKGNTKLGKQERAGLESIGFSKDWTGKVPAVVESSVSMQVKTLTPKKKAQRLMRK